MDATRDPGRCDTPPNRIVTDGGWWIVPSLLATLAAGLALPVNFAFAMFSMMPMDSCGRGPDDCGGGPTGYTVLLAGGTITAVVCAIFCWVARRPAQRVARMMLAFVAMAAAVMPLLIVFGFIAGR